MVVELITNDKNGQLQCVGRCKLKIDSVSKVLLVEPFNEFKRKKILEMKILLADFKWHFFAKKNILFVFGDNDFQDLALIFDESKKCNKVYDFLLKHKAASGSDELIQERFLPKLFSTISKSDDSNSKTMKQLFLKWIKDLEEKDKTEIIQILKDNNVYEMIFTGGSESKGRNLRKAKPQVICDKDKAEIGNTNACKNQSFVDKKLLRSNNKNLKRPRSNLKSCGNKIIESPYFEVLKYVINGISKTKLTVFPTSNQKLCHEYFWYKSKSYFYCCECWEKSKKRLTAKIVKRNGKDVIQLNETPHICELQEYNGIIETPNYKIITFEREKLMMTRLIIFMDSSSRDKCYEYTCKIKNGSKVYYCCGCLRKKIYLRADICQKEDDGNGTEFVMLKSKNHVCEMRKYNPENFVEKEIVEDGNFKIFENIRDGIDKSKLVVFADDEKKTCYEYYYDNFKKAFCCCCCHNLDKCVVAELCCCKNGSKYLKLSREKHVCEPREYNPEKFDVSKKDIIEAPNFKIFKYKHNKTSTTRLIIFDPTNKNLCYEYYKMKETFHCSTCPQGSKATATLYQKEDFKDFVILNIEKHVCNLIEFDPEKYKDDAIVDKSMYEITSTTYRNCKNKILNIFVSDEKKFYYKFIYKTAKKCFYCSACLTSRIHITATIFNEGKENECAFVSNQKHICQPAEYSSQMPKIIKAPNYQFIKRKANGKIVQRVAVFTNEEKSECYEYTWSEKDKYFLCFACQRQKSYVHAKKFSNDENEECIELSEKLHKCKPIKFIPENVTPKIIKSSDFKLFKAVYNQKNVERLAIFDSKDRSYGYVYTYSKQTKTYVCSRCQKYKRVFARLCHDEKKDEPFVELGENEHVCELQKI